MKTKPARSIAMQALFACAGAAAFALGMGVAASPANASPINNDNVTYAGETGPGITVVTLDQTIAGLTSIVFGPEAFDASLAAGGNLNISVNPDVGGDKVLNTHTSCTVTTCQLLDLAFGDPIPGSGTFGLAPSGTEFNTLTFDNEDKQGVYYGFEFQLPSGGEDQGWVEFNFDQPEILQYAYGVPEPSSLSLFAVGAAAVLALRRRKPAKPA